MALTRPRLGQLTTNVAAISDPITVLHSTPTQSNVDVGFVFNRSNGITSNVALYWNEANNRFATVYTPDAGGSDPNVVITSYATLATGDHNVLGNLVVSGTVTFLQSEIIAGAQVTAGNLVANSGMASSSTTTGALVVVGGVGISGAMNIGGSITATGYVNANLNGTALQSTNVVGGGIGQIPFQTSANNTSFNSSLIFTSGNSTLSATTVSAIGLVAGATGLTTQTILSGSATTNIYANGTQSQINIGTGTANVGIPGTAWVGSATSANGYFWANGSPYIPYANVNVATYLPVYSGNLAAGNLAVTSAVSAASLAATSITAGSLATGTITSSSSTVNVYTTGTQSQINIGTSSANVGITGTVYAGNITSVAGYFWANGTPYIPPSTYTNSNVASYLTVYGGSVLASSITTTLAATLASLVTNAISSSSSVTNIYTTGSQSQINIGTSGANVGITGIVYAGNVVSTNGYFWANGTPYASYSNVNVANYLPVYSGNLAAGNIAVSSNIAASYATIGATATASSVVATSSITVGPVPVLQTSSTTTGIGASPVAIDTFATSAYRGAKYVITSTDVTNSQYQTAEIIVVHDGTTPSISVYGVVNTGPSTIMTFSASIATGTVTLYGTGVSASNTVKLVKMLIPV